MSSARIPELQEISVAKIDRNPENPRLLFRPAELEQLTESIRLYGVQVPIAVYRERSRFVLIDGERRWRCSLKLNLKTIPALIQDKPSPLRNLLLMFNIHALREQWDLLTLALKLPRVIDLLAKELGTAPNERQISERTGLSRGLIRRCKLLMELPQQYKDELLAELDKPKTHQKLSEDFFIEMERALKTIERALPDIVQNKDRVRRVLIDKYRKGIIANVVQFRQLPKIARAEKVDISVVTARDVLLRVLSRNDYSIEQAYNDTVAAAYVDRDLRSRIQSLVERLTLYTPEDLDDETREQLKLLVESASHLLDAE